MGWMSWVKSGWATARRVLSIANDVETLRGDVARLRDDVAALQKSAPPRPEVWFLDHGIYWGAPPGDDKLHAYCPGCAADGTYTPMSRSQFRHTATSPQQIAYSCPKCKASCYLDPKDEPMGRGT